MVWATVPVVAGTNVLKTAFDEVRAAIVERCTATGTSVVGLPTSAADGDQPLAILTLYRAWVDTLIPLFVNPAAGYAAFVKATLLNALIGAPNWVANPDAVPKKMYIREINELRTVLNALAWVAWDFDSLDGFTYWQWASSNVSWGDAWTQALMNYPGMPSGQSPNGSAGFGTDSMSPSPPDGQNFYKDIYRFEFYDGAKAIPNVPVAATRLLIQKVGHGDAGVVDLHEQALYGGGATTINVGAADNLQAVLNLTPATPGATLHYSMRNNPALPDPNSYPPADVNGAKRGWQVNVLKLYVQFSFGYA